MATQIAPGRFGHYATGFCTSPVEDYHFLATQGRLHQHCALFFSDILGQHGDNPDTGVGVLAWLSANGYVIGYRPAKELTEKSRYVSFALIREPYDRLVSAFIHKFVYRGNTPIDRIERLESFARIAYTEISQRTKPTQDLCYTGLTFRDFVSYCLEKIALRGAGEPELNPHWNTQIPFLYYKSGFSYDFLYAISSAELFFKAIAERTDSPFSLRHYNATPLGKNTATADLVDVNSLEYCSKQEYLLLENFEDAQLRDAVISAYAPDILYGLIARR